MTVPQAPSDDQIALADHEEQSVAAIADFHHEHYRSASPLAARPGPGDRRARAAPLVVAAILGVAAWIGIAEATGHGGVTQPAFVWLELAATVSSVLVSMLILATQRREDLLGDRRAKLILELAILADRKNAKIIALLEELRRDHPGVVDRIDVESDDMARPTDPSAVLAAIDERAQPDRTK